jgi:hypothetical protein
MTTSEARRWQDSPDPSVRAEARRVLAARSSRSRRTAPKRKPGREAKEAKRAYYRQETARLREALVVLTDSTCERCGAWTTASEGHMHHTCGGNGRRREEQSIENVAWLCVLCHGRMHANPAEARRFRDELAAKRAAQHPSPPATLTGADDER